MLFTTLSFARTQTPPADNAQQSTHHLAFAKTDGVQSVAFSPDSTTLYVHLHAPSINVWHMATTYWPELLGALVAIQLLFLLMVIVRTIRRPQAKGSPYCRRCNYDLSSHVTVEALPRRSKWNVPQDAKCPECGLELSRRRPITGRKAWRRLAPNSIACAITALALGVLLFAGVSRFQNSWLNWSWDWVNTLSEKPRFAWLKRWQEKKDRIVEVDLATGNVVRHVLSRPVFSYLEMCVSPDGESLFLGGIGNDATSRYSARTGSLMARLTAPGYTIMNNRKPAIIRFSRDGQLAYVPWLDTKQHVCGVSEWNLRTDEQKTLITTAAHVDQRSGRPFSYSRSFLSSEQIDPPTFISYPHFMEAYPTKTYKIRVHAAGSSEQREFQPAAMPDNSSEPVLTPDGRRMIVQEQYGRSVMIIDLESGAILDQLNTGLNPVGQGLTMSRDGALLAVGMHRAIRIRDLDASKWRGQMLKIPDGLYAPRLWLSNDHRWLAAVCQKNLVAAGVQTQAATQSATAPAAPRGFTHELVLWDLSKMQSDSSE